MRLSWFLALSVEHNCSVMAADFVVRDSSYCVDEETPPQNAYVVHISRSEKAIKEVRAVSSFTDVQVLFFNILDTLRQAIRKSGDLSIANFETGKFALLTLPPSFTLVLQPKSFLSRVDFIWSLE